MSDLAISLTIGSVLAGALLVIHIMSLELARTGERIRCLEIYACCEECERRMAER